MTALERLAHFERFCARIQNTHDTIRELEAIARNLEPPLPPKAPRYISREDLEINAAEQRCIASLERVNRAALHCPPGKMKGRG